MRFGTVALIGRSNVGKSTFLNAVLDEELAIVSPLPQTTRDTLLGVVTREDAQLAFLDTPGLHRPKSELGRRMNHAALEAARGTDVVVLMTAIPSGPHERGPADAVSAEDRAIVARLPPAKTTPTLLVINKVDVLRDKGRLLPLIEAFSALHAFHAVIPTSMRQKDGVDRVLTELVNVLPEGEPGYASDTLTDKPTRYFVREFVREQVLRAVRGEVPHAVAVSLERFEEGPVDRISATMHVEKVGQRKILVGDGGSMIRSIGTEARGRIERFLGQRVHLELFVRVTPRWKNAPRMLAELGYQKSEDPEAAADAELDPEPKEPK